MAKTMLTTDSVGNFGLNCYTKLQMKNTKKILILLGLVLFFSPVSLSLAADGSRYFVKTNSQFWKNAFNARHEFKDGFTADLNDWQIKFGRLLGIDIEPVVLLQVLPAEEIKEIVPVKSGEAGAKQFDRARINGNKSATRVLPSDQTPWGVEYVYNDPLISKTSGGAGVRVAVLDTGITLTHPDLKDRVAKCKDFTNFRTPVVDGKCEDKNGHGTHVAGIIAADGGGDGKGIYGMAPEASLFAYRVCSLSGSCYADDVAVGVSTAADEGADIINLSLGADRPSDLISGAIDYAVSKGVLVVAAAGNDGPYFGSIDYPAAQKAVVAVGAFNFEYVTPDWSSRGINSTTTPYVVEDQDIELAAPGVNIESTWKNGGYAILSGTSMAAPFVSGLAAKEWPSDLLITNPAQWVRDLMHTKVIDLLPPGDDDASGFGFSRVKI